MHRYDVLSSLKSATQSKRQGTQEPIYYHITDSTHIAKVTLKKLISDTKTKAELTAFLAQKVMERGEATRKKVVVAWVAESKATCKDVSHLQNDHEESDTKIIVHALDTTADGATELSICSPDTNVLVLAIRRYQSRDVPKYKFCDWISNNSLNNQVATTCRSTWINQDSCSTSIPCLNRG